MPRRRNGSGADDSRRKFLKASGAGAVALSLAGCSGNNNNNNDNDGTDGTSDGPGGTETTEVSGYDIGPDQIEAGGTLRYGMATPPDSPNYMLAGSVYSAVALDPIYDFGLTQDPVTFEYKPGVFTDWTAKNTDSENPDIYANVRKDGLEWNDGEKWKPIEDTLFSYQFQLDNQPGEWSVWNYFNKVEEASNDWDLHIKMAGKIGTWESSILAGAPIIPKHIWSNVDYQKYNPVEEQDEGPVGTGPAKLVKYKPDTAMQLETRRDYVENTYALNSLEWKKNHDAVIHGGPFLDKVNFKVYGGKTPMTQAYLNGEIDTHYGSLSVEKIPQARNKSGMGLVKGFDSGFTYLGYNCRRQPLDDVALRQAMAFLFDDKFWVQKQKNNFVIKGDYAQAPGYKAVRPESVWDGKLLEAPETEAFNFRRKQGKEPDVQGIRNFLTNGNVISGSGDYVGQQFPGTFSGVEASRSSAKHNYSFGSPQTQVIRDQQGADKEIRVNGQTIPEMMDGDAITVLIDPPGDKPKEAKAINQWVTNLKKVGIPAKTKPIAFNTMKAKAYVQEDFDIYPMGWGGTSPLGTSMRVFFHSENAGGDTDKTAYNSTGYGVSGGSADDLLDSAQKEMEPKKRNKKWAKAIEKVYLDQPYMVWDYAKYRWPMNTQKFDGYIEGIVDPGYATWSDQLNNIYLKKNVKK
ncbi:ABC transporter substrate-binding protein [Halomicrococcus sp. SG-WS-1]|uniref:ABC transporter substrate-binding protein n=1 Tax=Halomicrococcus sp. SG-WS-1 TaxID=3439057 RepID=UPI003F7921B9